MDMCFRNVVHSYSSYLNIDWAGLGRIGLAILIKSVSVIVAKRRTLVISPREGKAGDRGKLRWEDQVTGEGKGCAKMGSERE
jgi:hypothetical protein